MLPRCRRPPEARAGVTDGGQAGIGPGLQPSVLRTRRCASPLSLRFATVVEPKGRRYAAAAAKGGDSHPRTSWLACQPKPWRRLASPSAFAVATADRRGLARYARGHAPRLRHPLLSPAWRDPVEPRGRGSAAAGQPGRRFSSPARPLPGTGLACQPKPWRRLASPRGFEPRSGASPSEDHRLPLKWTSVDTPSRAQVAQKCAQTPMMPKAICFISYRISLYLTFYPILSF